MVDQIIRPADLANERTTPVDTEFMVVDNGVTVAKSTIGDVVKSGRPAASQAEAEAGTDPTKAMTPLTTKQAIIAQGDVRFASFAQGALANTAVQPGDLAAVATSGAYADLIGSPPALTDGDKGDITVSGVGSVWAINDGSVDDPALTDALTLTLAKVCYSKAELLAVDRARYNVAFLVGVGTYAWSSADLSNKVVFRQIASATVTTGTDTFNTKLVTSTSVNATTNLITSAAHGLVNGQRVAPTTAVNGLAVHQPYYVRASGTNNFYISEEAEGDVFDLTGTTNFTLYEVSPFPLTAPEPFVISVATADLAANTVYWGVWADRGNWKVATSLANALANIFVDITVSTNITAKILRDHLGVVWAVPTALDLAGSQGAWVLQQPSKGCFAPSLLGGLADAVTIKDIGGAAGSVSIYSQSGSFKASMVGKPIIIRNGRNPVPFTSLGAWSNVTAYVAGDIATNGGFTWRAKQANTNVTPVDGADWGKITPDTSKRPWVTTVASYVGPTRVDLAAPLEQAVGTALGIGPGVEATIGTDNRNALHYFFKLLERGVTGFRGAIDGSYATSQEIGYYSGTTLDCLAGSDLIWIGSTVLNGGFFINAAAFTLRAQETRTDNVVINNLRINCSYQPNMNGLATAYTKNGQFIGGAIRNAAIGPGSDALGDFSYGGAGIASDGTDGMIVNEMLVEDCAFGVKVGANNSTKAVNVQIKAFVKNCALPVYVLQKDAVTAVSPGQYNVDIDVRGHNCGNTGGNVVGQSLGLLVVDRANYGTRVKVAIDNDPAYGPIQCCYRGLRSIGGFYEIDFNGDLAHYVDFSQLPAGWIPNGVSEITKRLNMWIRHGSGTLSGAMVTGADALQATFGIIPDVSHIRIETPAWDSVVTAGNLSNSNYMHLSVSTPNIAGGGIVNKNCSDIFAAGNTIATND